MLPIRRTSFIAFAFALGACSGFDGGIEPTTRLPPPRLTDATGGDTAAPDTSADTLVPDASPHPVLSFVSPIAGAAVDGDWIPVTLALEGHTLGAGDALVLTSRSAAGEPMYEVASTSLSGVLYADAGDVVLAAELTTGGAPLDPPVVAEIAVASTRVTPTLTFTRPTEGEGFAEAATVPWALALTDFTLLAQGATPTGPRQGASASPSTAARRPSWPARTARCPRSPPVHTPSRPRSSMPPAPPGIRRSPPRSRSRSACPRRSPSSARPTAPP